MNRATFVLAGHSFRRMRGLLLAMALLLAVFEFLLTQMATYLLRHSAFNELANLFPDILQTISGSAGLLFMSFAGIVAFGYFHPIVIAGLLGLTIAIATEPAAEVERRFVDLTLARPATRTHAIARTLIVLAVSSGLVLALMLAGTEIGLSCCTPADAPRPDARLIASLALELGAVMACWAGIAFLAASLSRRRTVAASIVGIVALGMYLLDYLGRAWEPARPLSRVSPFHYFEPMTLVAGVPLDMRDVGILLTVGLAAGAIGALVFSRRDL